MIPTRLHRTITLLVMAAAMSAARSPGADDPAAVFQMNCAACHSVDRAVVGPSLVEISTLYRDKPDEFVAWCVAPKHKRPGAIEMPSMAHLGEPVLRTLHPYILKTAEGKTEVKLAEGDPFAIPAAAVRRPQVQRIFLPDASPAAIAVALPGDLSFCFDAAECRLRYVWKGGFIDAWPYWKGNGSSLAKIDGEVVYREEKSPISPATGSGAAGDPPMKFLGYRVSPTGIPTFRYEKAGLTLSETIEPLPDGSGITRRFEVAGGHPVSVNPPSGVSVSCDSGTEENGTLYPDASQPFTLTYRWK